jgi:Zn-dependent protease
LTRTQELSLAATVEFSRESQPAFVSRDEEAVYDLVWREVAAGQAAKPAGLGTAVLLLLSLGLFVWAGRGAFDPLSLVLLVGVLLVHEAGHYLGMKAFGYTDLKMFFVPFLGAAVSGTKHAAPAWQQGVVILLGPLPGILLGAALYLTCREPYFDGFGFAALCLVLLNVGNLVPIEPFDGGKLMNLLVYSRHPSAELFFLILAVAFLGGFGWLGGHWVLVGVAVFVLIGVWPRHVRATRAAELRRARPDMADRLENLTPTDRLLLFRTAVGMLGGPGGLWPNPQTAAGVLKSVHEAVVVRPPSAGASAGFLVACGLGWAMAVGMVMQWSADRQAAADRVTADAARGRQLMLEANRVMAGSRSLAANDAAAEWRRAEKLWADGHRLWEGAKRTADRLAVAPPGDPPPGAGGKKTP